MVSSEEETGEGLTGTVRSLATNSFGFYATIITYATTHNSRRERQQAMERPSGIDHAVSSDDTFVQEAAMRSR